MKDLITRDVIVYFIAIIVSLIFGFNFIAPNLTSLIETNKKITDIRPQIADLERTLKEKPADENQSFAVNGSNMPKIEVYKSPYQGITADDASSFLVSSLIEKIRKNNITVTQIAYNDFATANQQLTLPASCKALNITFDLVTDYNSLQRLIETIQTWQYLVGIQKITIKRNAANDNKIDANFTIILFVEGTQA